jgi:hypothetical protein
MEDLAPPLKMILSLRSHISRGHSLRLSLRETLLSQNDDFGDQVLKWLALKEQNPEKSRELLLGISDYRRAIIELLDRGLEGQMVLERLVDLEVEVALAADKEISEFIQQLPYRLMLPIVLFIFPALLLLMLGPIVMQFLTLMH